MTTGEQIFIAVGVQGATSNNSPFFLSSVSLSPVSSLSSVIPPVLPKDSQKAGNGNRVITGREGRKGRWKGTQKGKQCVKIVQ